MSVSKTINENLLEEQEKALEQAGISLTQGQYMHLIMKEKGGCLTTFNVSRLFKMKKGTDIEKLELAVNRVLSIHPVYRTKLKKTNDSSIKQIYDEKLLKPVPVIEMTDPDFEQYKVGLVKTFDIYNSALYRIEIIRTPSADYLFMDHHHLITDGMSLQLVLSQIFECYNDLNTKLQNKEIQSETKRTYL